jgi:[ribosomal protein S5]-alanine N-acetyltransferase
MDSISTQRLTLQPLSLEQLKMGLVSLNDLSASVGVQIVSSLFEGVVDRAVRMKIEKMSSIDSKLHPWYTYWLIVINQENTGAGMVGFKGVPNESGAVEIGYGIDPLFQRLGYMSEAVQAMIDWAFSHKECHRITATGVLPDNFASQKVLLRNGFIEIGQDEKGINYEVERKNWLKIPY